MTERVRMGVVAPLGRAILIEPNCAAGKAKYLF